MKLFAAALSTVVLAVPLALCAPAIAAPSDRPCQEVLLARCIVTSTNENFGRLFSNLPGFTAPTTQEDLDLSLADQDPNLPPENLNEPSGMTYLGQFADHDLTLDLVPQPVAPIDPATIPNNRTFMFDLDSVFGNGPSANPELYAADGKHLCIQNPNPNGVPDVCRNPNGSAVIPDGRNDENEIIGQIQVAFIEFYNRLIDQGMSYEQARSTEVHYWQWIVLHELLPTFVGQNVVDQYLSQVGASPNYRLSTPLFPSNTFTPVEFSVAAYRLHTIVRLAYVINDTPGNKIQVFNAAGNDLHGGRNIPAGRQIDWGNFLTQLATTPPVVNGAPAADFNFGRPFDHLISKSLFNLPIPGAEPSGSNNLAFRNLDRGRFYALPSGQDVARALGVDPIPADQINPTTDAVFNTATPLWQYINAEAERTQGSARLGPVGAAIVAQTMLRVLASSPDSIIAKQGATNLYRLTFHPDSSFIAPCSGGQFNFASFVVFAGAAGCP
jgi:hypothetical protein